METATAHRYWNESWTTAEGRAEYARPEPDVVTFAAGARLAGASRALDLGCGIGRHAVALARLGFEVDAFDASPEAVAQTAAAAAGLAVRVAEGQMTALPYPDGAFDAVVTWNVIYHGDPLVVEGTIAEIVRVLKPGGRLLVTMLTDRDIDYGIGEEIAPGTFVNPDATDDKVHPHLYCDAARFIALFRAFHVVTLRTDDQGYPGASYFTAVLERRP